MEVAFRQGKPELRVSYRLSDAKEEFFKLRDAPVTFERTGRWRARTRCPIVRPLALTRLTERGQRFANYFHFKDRSRVAKPGRPTAQGLLRRHYNGETQAVRNAINRMKKMQPYMNSTPESLMPRAIQTNSALMSVGQFPAHVAFEFARLLSAQNILDFCGGWGDRLSGFLASPETKKITVVEPRASAHRAYRLQLNHTERKDVALRTIQDFAENVIPALRSKFDLIMTSPPYAGAEIYDRTAHRESAATRPGAAYVEEWLGPLLARCIQLLRPGGALVINVDDSPSINVEICASLLAYMRKVPCDFVGTVGLRKRGMPRGLMRGMPRAMKDAPSDIPVAEPIYIWSRKGEGAAVRAAVLR